MIRGRKIVVPPNLKAMLSRRGMEISYAWEETGLLLPKSASRAMKERFYEEMKRYSFRLVLRDIIKHKDSFEGEDLTHFCSINKVEEYLAMLEKMGVIKKRKGTYRLLLDKVKSFGDTLEWFVAEMLKKEFYAEALWGLRFKDNQHGGDYDVVAEMESYLTYVEVKSSPPKHIEQPEVRAFLDRIEDLIPALSLFFVDTELRMKDKIVPMFEEELKIRCEDDAKRLYPVVRLRDELFHINHDVFIVNSRRDVIANFRYCVRDFLSHHIVFPHPQFYP